MKKKEMQTVRGFTLMELLAALFIFSIIMMATAQIFSTAYSGYRLTRLVQRDLENTQYVLNALAKSLRTSTVVSASGNQQGVQFFDYSQDRCIQYRISGGTLEMASNASSGVADCAGMTLGSFVPVTTGTVTGSFHVTKSATVGGPPSQVGKVTIALSIGENSAHTAHMQTTVSLRDFGNIGL